MSLCWVLVVACGISDLRWGISQGSSSPTRDWTQVLHSGSMESEPLDHQGSPWVSFLERLLHLSLFKETCWHIGTASCFQCGSSEQKLWNINPTWWKHLPDGSCQKWCMFHFATRATPLWVKGSCCIFERACELNQVLLLISCMISV